MDMNGQARQVARILLQIKAIQLNPDVPFIWASGIQSPIYCDNRLLLSHVSERTRVHEMMREVAIKAFGNYHIVAGVATAGIPHAAVLAHLDAKPMIYVRSKPKDHGRRNLIEGRLEPGASVLVVEDLISTGGSSLQAVEAIRNQGASVAGVLAIFSYGFAKATQAFEEADCPLVNLTGFEALSEVAAEEGYIEKQALESLLEWRDQFK